MIQLSNINKIYQRGTNQTHALTNVNFTADAGELISIVGPSGSGKSTFLKIVGGILTPTSGQVVINGADYAQMNAKQRAQMRLNQIGFILQNYNLLPFLTVADQFRFLAKVKKQGRLAPAELKRLTQELAIDNLMDQYPDQLSGGQQQRVAIAKAMATDPQIILADEPTAALDGKRAALVMQIFQRLAHEHGKTVLLITHDSRLIQYVDRNYQIVDGRGQFVSKQDQALV